MVNRRNNGTRNTVVARLRPGEVLANEVDEENNQVLELAVDKTTGASRLFRVLPEHEALEILQIFIKCDDPEYVLLCKKVINFISNGGRSVGCDRD